MSTVGYEWPNLVSQIGDARSEVAKLEAALESSRMKVQTHNLSTQLFSISFIAGIALFFTNAIASTILIALSILGALYFAIRSFREEKKSDEMAHKYSEAQSKLETLKAMLAVGASLGQWKE